MAKINLLPTELVPAGPVAKFAGILRGTIVVGFSIFIFVVVGTISLFIFNSINIGSSKARQAVLTASIKSLEVTEQRLVLVKDRVQIAKAIWASDSASDDLATLTKLLSSISGSASLSEAAIASNRTKFSVLSGNSSDLARFMAALVSENLYKKIELMSFSYSPTNGYVTSFESSVK